MRINIASGSFLLVTLLASIVSGSVISDSDSKGFFEVKRIANTAFTGRNGPLAVVRAYQKHSIPVSPVLKRAISNANALQMNKYNGTGIAVTTPDNFDAEYLVPVQIGTPGQMFNLELDTGSSDLWVFTNETQSSGGHNIYSPSSSCSSQQLQGATWNISYNDGSSASGDVYTDTVSIGGLTVARQAVETAQQVSPRFIVGIPDGLLGMAFKSKNTVQPTQQQTWFDNILASLNLPLFVADLRHDAPGSYIFGSIPSNASNVSYAPVDKSQGFWQFNTTVSGGSTISAIADTGTSLLLTRDDIVSAYYANVQGATFDQSQGGFVFDCHRTLPDFTFSVGNGQITVPGRLINFGGTNNGTCFGGIQSSGGLSYSIFGDVALKAAYVVFDIGNNQVGWAQKS